MLTLPNSFAFFVLIMKFIQRNQLFHPHCRYLPGTPGLWCRLRQSLYTVAENGHRNRILPLLRQQINVVIPLPCQYRDQSHLSILHGGSMEAI